MCGGGGGGDSPLARQAAAQEDARQAQIKQGMRDLELMFQGGQRVSGQVGAGAKYDPNAAYYTKEGAAWTPGDIGAYRMSHPMVTDYGGSERQGEETIYRPATYAADTAPDEVIRQKMFDEAMGGGLYTGVTQEKGYQPEFYDKAYKAQLDYALPQVDKQFAQAQRDLTYALARQGLSQSSVQGQLEADLTGQRSLAIQGEQEKARQVKAQQQSAVEAERDNLTRMLQSTGDVASTMNAAASRKAVLEAAPQIQEVSPLFQNATGALADMIVNPALRQAGGTSTSAGYGGPSKGSGKVVT